MRITLALVALLFAAGCTYQGVVPKVSGSTLADVGKKQSGHYAAVIQSGGWDMTTDMQSWTCSAHAYKADLNPAWDSEMKEALASALENVEFVGAVLTPAEIYQKGYNSLLVFTQSNASAIASVKTGFFTGETNAETKLDIIMVIQFSDGRKEQQALSASGSATDSTFTCGEVADVVAASGGVALQNLVRSVILTTKLLLAQSAQQSAFPPLTN